MFEIRGKSVVCKRLKGIGRVWDILSQRVAEQHRNSAAVPGENSSPGLYHSCRSWVLVKEFIRLVPFKG